MLFINKAVSKYIATALLGNTILLIYRCVFSAFHMTTLAYCVLWNNTIVWGADVFVIALACACGGGVGKPLGMLLP